MDQHPVPQPITSYEFRLVGDMTLKQFVKLASGCVLALIVYGINPPVFLKWPLILLFTGLGAAMAFLPFEGRSVDVWIVAFFKRIYSPTQFIWRSKAAVQKTVNPQPVAEKVIEKAVPITAPTPPVTPVISIKIPSPTPTPPPQVIFKKPIETISAAPVIPAAPTPVVAKKVEPVTSFSFAPRRQVSSEPRQNAQFAQNLIFPTTPSIPNLLVGLVRDKQGGLIIGAILEIRDSFGNPVRAFKTNKLGQFLSATPLSSGVYEIETEKEGYSFDIIKVTLKGEILKPIEIISK